MNSKYDMWMNEDKFSEPRTIPPGWNSAALGDMSDSANEIPEDEAGQMEKFAEPRTIPDGWNVDALR